MGAAVAIADRLLHPHQQVNAETKLSPTSQAIPIKAGEIPRRKLGRTGVEVSALTLGGFHLGVPNEPEAIRIVQEALDAGVAFMDNAWEYNEGVSEQRLGKALQGRRDKAFVMTKVCNQGRDRNRLPGREQHGFPPKEQVET